MVAGLALFYLELVIEPVSKQGDQGIKSCLVNEDGDRHVHAVRFVSYFNLLFLEKVQELIMLGVADSDVDGGLDDLLDKAGLVNGVGSDITVCPDEPAGPELDPTEVPGDYGDNVMELGQLKGFQNRHPGCSTGFPIVTFPLDLVVIADHVGKAIVVGLAVGGLDLGNKVLGSLLCVSSAN